MKRFYWPGVVGVGVLMVALLAPVAARAQGEEPAWRGEYYRNRHLAGETSKVHSEAELDFNWGLGSPFSDWNADNWSARWTRKDSFEAGVYVFGVNSDDGARLYVDGLLIIDNWWDGPRGWQIVEVSLAAGEHTVVVEYYEVGAEAFIEVVYYPFEDPGPFWRGEYFPNMDLQGSPDQVLYADVLTLDWEYSVPFANWYADRWSARFTRVDEFSNQTYTFGARADDGVRLYVDGELIIDQWGGEQYLWHTVEKEMTAGQHTVVVEFFEHIHLARIQAGYYPEDPTLRPMTATPTPTLTPTATPGTAVGGGTTTSGGGSSGAGATLPTRTPLQPTSTPTATATPPYIVGTPGAVAALPPPGVDVATALFADEANGKLFSWSGFPGLVFTPGGYQGQYAYTKNQAEKRTVEARWVFKPDVAEYYDVYVYIPETAVALTSAATYTIRHSDRVSPPIAVDQAASAGQWVALGTFYFGAMGGQYVRLDNVTGEPAASRAVAFDAIMFVPSP